MDSKLVVLRRYAATIHADLARSALEAHDIEAVVRGGEENTGRWVPGNPIEMWARSEAVARANEILGDDETSSNP